MKSDLQEELDYLYGRLEVALQQMDIKFAVPFARFCGIYLHLTGITEMNHRYGSTQLLCSGLPLAKQWILGQLLWRQPSGHAAVIFC